MTVMALKFINAPTQSAPTAIKTPVALSSPQAKMLGQLVNGTSNVYKVFAYNEDMAVAVRAGGYNSVSIRIEMQSGKKFPAGVVDYFVTLGLTAKKGYLSGHLSFASPLTAYHVLAPIVFNPLVQWQAYSANLSVIL